MSYAMLTFHDLLLILVRAERRKKNNDRAACRFAETSIAKTKTKRKKKINQNRKKTVLLIISIELLVRCFSIAVHRLDCQIVNITMPHRSPSHVRPV